MLATANLLAEAPFRLPERIVDEAERVSGGQAALYVVDIAGTALRRLAGSDDLPREVRVDLGVGPELGAVAADRLAAQLTGAGGETVVAPLWLRGRATCVLVATQGSAEELAGVAEMAAPAVELASGYTDVFDRGRRHRPATPAAEIQQDLLAPRLAQVTAGRIAGSVIPAYDVGGDWFDHAENPELVWLGVADAMGRGLRASAVSSVAIGACRAARRAGADLEECCASVDRAVDELSSNTFVTMVLATWDAATRTLAWVNCGHPLPLLIPADGDVRELDGAGTHPLGLWRERRSGFVRNEVVLERGDRVVLYSDGVTDRRRGDGSMLGLEGLVDVLGTVPGCSAVQTVQAIEGEIRGLSEQDLADDATQLVLEITA